MIKRKSFGKIKAPLAIPNLIQVQLQAYARFLQLDKPKNKRENLGLQAVLKEVFPVEEI